MLCSGSQTACQMRRFMNDKNDVLAGLNADRAVMLQICSSYIKPPPLKSSQKGLSTAEASLQQATSNHRRWRNHKLNAILEGKNAFPTIIIEPLPEPLPRRIIENDHVDFLY